MSAAIVAYTNETLQQLRLGTVKDLAIAQYVNRARGTSCLSACGTSTHLKQQSWVKRRVLFEGAPEFDDFCDGLVDAVVGGDVDVHLVGQIRVGGLDVKGGVDVGREKNRLTSS